MSADLSTVSAEVAVYHRLFSDKYRELYELVLGLPDEALLWKPFEESPWQGPCKTLGEVVAHAISSTVYLLRRAEYAMGRCEWQEVDGDEGPQEFGPANHEVAYLQARIRRTQNYATQFLLSLQPGDLDAVRIHPERPRELSARFDMIHALDHLAQHLGHGQITRQLWAIQSAQE